MLNTFASPTSAATAGFVLGLLFFGGLWLTISRGLASERPGLWFLSSMLLRSATVIAGIMLLVKWDAGNLICSLAGFGASRMLVTRLGPLSKKERQHRRRRCI